MPRAGVTVCIAALWYQSEKRISQESMEGTVLSWGLSPSDSVERILATRFR